MSRLQSLMTTMLIVCYSVETAESLKSGFEERILEEENACFLNSPFRLCFGRDLLLDRNRVGGQNPAKLTKAEKALPAGIAAVGWKAQEALGKHEPAFFYPVARDTLQVEVAAFRTVDKTMKTTRRTASVKPEFAGAAPPGPVSKQRGHKIPKPSPMRTVAFRAATLRANHPHPLGFGQNSETLFPPQALLLKVFPAVVCTMACEEPYARIHGRPCPRGNRR